MYHLTIWIVKRFLTVYDTAHCDDTADMDRKAHSYHGWHGTYLLCSILILYGSHHMSGHTVQAFEAVINDDEDAAESWAGLGVCMARLDQPEAALVCQKQVLRIRG